MTTLFVPYPTLTFAPLILADRLGYLRETVPTVQFRFGGMDRYQAVLQGQEPGVVPLIYAALRAYQRGARPRVLCSVFNQVVHRLVAKPEVRGLADLPGRVVMVNAFGGTSDLETRVVLRKAGVPLEKIRFVEAGADLEMAQLQALRRGEVDAIASSSPFWHIAEREGFVVLGDVGGYYDRWVSVALVASEPWVAAEPGTVAGLRACVRRASEVLHDRPEEALGVLTGVIPELSADVGRALLARLRGAWDPAVDRDGLRAFVEAYCAEYRLSVPPLEEMVAAGA